MNNLKIYNILLLGLVVHEACKDVAVVECRLKNSATQNGTTAGTTIAAGFTDWLSSPRSNGAKTSHNNKTTPIPSSGRKPIHIAYRCAHFFDVTNKMFFADFLKFI